MGLSLSDGLLGVGVCGLVAGAFVLAGLGVALLVAGAAIVALGVAAAVWG